MNRRGILGAASGLGALALATTAVEAQSPASRGVGEAAPLTPMDYEEVRQLIARYSHCLDFQDIEGFLACFTPDGAFDSRSGRDGTTGLNQGTESLRKFALSIGAITQGHSRHTINTTLIEGNSLRVRSSSYLTVTYDLGMPVGARAWRKEPPMVGISTGGVYVDEIVKHEGKWKFLKRSFRYDAHPDILARVGKPVDLQPF